MQPRPQGAFPWLCRWDSKGREKRPGDEVGDGQQLCQDECKKQVFPSNCNVSLAYRLDDVKIIACVAGVRKGTGNQRAPKFPLPCPLLTPATQAIQIIARDLGKR